MAHQQSTDIRQVLNRLIPKARLKELAGDTGAVLRERKIGIVALFWTLVLGFATGNERTLAGLRRAFEKATGTTVVPSAFYGRLTPRLVRLLKAVLGEVMDKTAKMNGAMRGALASLRDVLLTDSTVIRLHDLLDHETERYTQRRACALAALNVGLMLRRRSSRRRRGQTVGPSVMGAPARWN
jgi:putative transposase